jgi:hypothetical protein
MAQWIAQEGLSLDVCSAGELAVARSVLFPAGRIILHGNAKTPEDLHAAFRYGVGRVVVDSIPEIVRLATQSLAPQRVLIRVTPGVDAHAHPAVATGTEDQKFGFSLSSGAAADAVHRVLDHPELKLAGLHCHLGSQLTDLAAYEAAARKLIGLMAAVRDSTGVAMAELNLGGGHVARNDLVRGDDAPVAERELDGTASVVPSALRRWATVSLRALRSVSAWALPRPSATASAKLANSTVAHSQRVTRPTNTLGPAANSTVVMTEPTSTRNMTGMRIIDRGLSLTSACHTAGRKIAGSSRAAAGRTRTLGGLVSSGSTGSTGAVTAGSPGRRAGRYQAAHRRTRPPCRGQNRGRSAGRAPGSGRSRARNTPP